MNTPIDPQHWQLAQQIFEAACELPEAERAALIRERCGGNASLAAGIEALIAVSEAGVREGGGLFAAAKVVGDAESEAVAEICEAPGTEIGPYRLVEQIGEGTFGVVFLAEQQHPVKRRVAVKIVKAGMDTRQIVKRFEAERQTLAAMNHEHIARVIDGGATEQGRPYFVMEYVQGEPITAYADRMTMGLSARLKLFVTVCDAIQHAHQRGIIHRDLKPNNILVTEVDGKPIAKVIDFGVAKAFGPMLADGTSMTERGQLVGTPEYMSPEQASLGSTETDTRSDVYSLGVVLYELIAGVLPFDWKAVRNAGLGDVLKTIREQDPPRPSTRLTQLDAERGDAIAGRRRERRATLVHDVRRELEWIPMKALKKDPSERYQSPMELAADIERYLRGDALLAGPESAGYRLRKFVKRNRGAVAAVVAVLIALAGGLGTALWQARESDRQRARADERAIAAETAEKAEKERADQLKKVSDFQAGMLGQIDTTASGVGLMADVRERFTAALEKAGVPEADRTTQAATLGDLLRRVNATDAAAAMIDRTIVQPAIKTIDEQFKNDPATDASLRQSVADLYRSIGLYAKAHPLQELALATRRRVLGEEHPDTLLSINNMGFLLESEGKLDQAEPYFREARERSGRVLGEEHRQTISSISNLGGLLQFQGKLDQAEPYFREALEKCRRVLGNEHPMTLTCIGSMGFLLESQGKFDQAEPYFREALEKSRRVLGEEHRQTLTSIGNMGFVLRSQGKLDQAEPYFREALEKSRRVLGEEHPKTLIAIVNMGALLHSQGKLDQAEPYYREALETSRRVLGEEHPDTLLGINNMGALLQSQGKFDQAEPYFREALEKSRRVLGEEHPWTLTSIGNLGGLLQDQGKLDQAEPCFREALKKSRRVLGEEHPNTLLRIHNLGLVLQGQGELDQAELYFREALEKSRRVLGEEHPDTLLYISNMGDLLRVQRKFDQAEPCFREALEKSRRVLGEDHPATLFSIHNMGLVLLSQGKFDQAEPYFREALQKFRRVLGEEHPNTLTVLDNMGALLCSQRKFDQAEPYFREALEKSRRVLGEEHPDTLTAIGNMGALLQYEGKHDQAELYYREALEKRRRVLGEAHADTLDSVSSMARLKLDQHKAQEALDLTTPCEPAARKKFIDGNARRLAEILAILGRARVGLGYDAERFGLAEANLLEAHPLYLAADDRGPTHTETLECVQALVDLYNAWDNAEPGHGFDVKAAEWKAKLPPTKPAAAPTEKK